MGWLRGDYGIICPKGGGAMVFAALAAWISDCVLVPRDATSRSTDVFEVRLSTKSSPDIRLELVAAAAASDDLDARCLVEAAQHVLEDHGIAEGFSWIMAADCIVLSHGIGDYFFPGAVGWFARTLGSSEALFVDSNGAERVILPDGRSLWG